MPLKKNNWFKNYTWLKNGNDIKWTKEKCLEEAKKYKTKSEFRVFSKLAYNQAAKRGYLNEITNFLWG